MVEECPVCGMEKSICEEYQKVVAWRSCFIIFLFMEALFGSAITFAVVNHSYPALTIFVVAAVTTIAMVVPERICLICGEFLPHYCTPIITRSRAKWTGARVITITDRDNGYNSR
jgi:hypothetical protein